MPVHVLEDKTPQQVRDDVNGFAPRYAIDWSGWVRFATIGVDPSAAPSCGKPDIGPASRRVTSHSKDAAITATLVKGCSRICGDEADVQADGRNHLPSVDAGCPLSY